jgi:hypothetical protein
MSTYTKAVDPTSLGDEVPNFNSTAKAMQLFTPAPQAMAALRGLGPRDRDLFFAVCRDSADAEFFPRAEGKLDMIPAEVLRTPKAYMALGIDSRGRDAQGEDRRSVILCFKSPTEEALLTRLEKIMKPCQPELFGRFTSRLPKASPEI